MPAPRVFTLFLCLCAAGLGWAQEPDGDRYFGSTIGGIRFEPESQPLPDEELRLLLAFREGQSLTRENIKQTIENLFRTGRFMDIAVEANPAAGGRADLTIRTTLNWFIGRVEFTGAAEPPSSGQLYNTTKLELGQQFDEGLINQAKENIGSALRLNGLYESSVEHEIRRDPDTQSVSIIFTVLPGRRARFTQPRFIGEAALPLNRLVRAANWDRWWRLFGWKTLNQGRVQSGIDRIRRAYLKSNYLMARVSLDGMIYQPGTVSAQPVVALEPGPVVEIRPSGARLSRSRIRQLVPVFQEQSVDRSLLLEGQRNIQQYFQTQGYFDAAVDFHIRDEAQRKFVDYAIVRGPRHRLVALQISGNRYFDLKTLRERMQSLPATFIRYRQGRFGSRLLEQDEASIRDLYRSNGFLDVKISHRVESAVQGKPNDEGVFLEIDEGPQTLVARIEFEGVNPERLDYVRSLLQTQEGQPYSEQSAGADRDLILNEYFNTGYSAASVEGVVQPAAEPHRMVVKFTVVEGRQLFVRRVMLGGLRTTDPMLIQQRLQLTSGAPLSQGAMLDTQRRLYDLGIFARVDVAVQNPEGSEQSKLVLYQVEEARRWSVSGGVGAEITRIGGGIRSFDSPAGGNGFSPRVSLGVARSNLFGVGHTAALQTRLSSIQQRVLASYLAPQFRDSDRLSLTFNALFDDSRNVRTFNSRRWEGSVQLGQRLTRANSMQYRLTYRRVSVDQSTLKIEPQLIPLLSQPVRIGIASLTFIQDRRDDPVDARKGWYSTLDAGVSLRAFTSASDFWRLLGRNSSYHRLSRDIVFARTLTAGWLLPLTNIPARDVPLPERFFSGGANSHRGFPENQAGPRDLVTGFPVGGKALLMMGHELRFPLIGDNLSGVSYHDAGNVYRDLRSVHLRFQQRGLQDFSYMVHTFGLGVRYRTPVGPIRFDIGYSPNAPRFRGFRGTYEDLLFRRGVETLTRVNPIQFHISLGQAF